VDESELASVCTDDFGANLKEVSQFLYVPSAEVSYVKLKSTELY
jgi:hypothetical protein